MNRNQREARLRELLESSAKKPKTELVLSLAEWNNATDGQKAVWRMQHVVKITPNGRHA